MSKICKSLLRDICLCLHEPLPNRFVQVNRIIYCMSYQDLISDIKQHNDAQKWSFISRNFILPELFIKEFQDQVNWRAISRHQRLSKEFIIEFQYKVYWDLIFEYQPIASFP